jgi:hypothetical protein
MYPELEKAGGLSKALDIEFAKANSSLRVSVDKDLDKIPFAYARVEKGNKLSQVYIAAESKLYLPDFWRDGVCLAHAKTDNILDLVKVINLWLTQDVSTGELVERFKFVEPNDKARAFDENKEVEYTWNYLLQNESKTDLHDFIKLAINDEVLNKLFPFTSLYTLCFSRCTGYPFDTDNLPSVTPKLYENFATQESNDSDKHVGIRQGTGSLYVVTKNMNKYLGEGNALDALKIVRDNLPDNVKPATKGTADK